MMPKMPKLTPLEWKVYRAIEASEEPIAQKDLCEAVGLAYRPLESHEGGIKHRDGCRKLWNIVQHLNDTTEVEKMVVVTPDYRYSLATEEEARKKADRYHRQALTLMRREYALRRKMRLNGQGKLLSAQGNPIDSKSKANPFFEAYPNEDRHS